MLVRNLKNTISLSPGPQKLRQWNELQGLVIDHNPFSLGKDKNKISKEPSYVHIYN